MEVRGNRWPGGSLEKLIQKDLLHPKVEGAIALALVTLDHLVEARDDVPEAAVRWKVADVRAALAEAAKKAREEEEAEDARKRERKRKKKKEEGDGARLLRSSR